MDGAKVTVVIHTQLVMKSTKLVLVRHAAGKQILQNWCCTVIDSSGHTGKCRCNMSALGYVGPYFKFSMGTSVQSKIKLILD